MVSRYRLESLVSLEATYDDDVAHGHADGTNDQGRLPAPAIDVHDGRDGGDEHHDADDTSCQQTDRVAAQA